ncbi:protein WEAK CHLOROPLAST MOVEMENT UNDER BLUE LIGHT 1-like [Cynara cardunculus var. scolymus]|uniref:WEB family n=1 Tax=Cynara cardunculus var. scolymus TaxID=59895 RepID=A0A103XYU7_CYNCS|nr:protein WEAK CHLOROPLAST MOVEMENT UNDER BLUE LIGHT 1-like [Cynara cardunculus var. scolymus]KVH99437.1 Protein of unknown function DUF827, plant [Cynara cardunculus var. scolymus]
MDEVKTLEENVTTNGDGSANLVKNEELEPQTQVREMDANNGRDVIGEENPSDGPEIEQKASTHPKPLDSPIDDRLTPSPEPLVQQSGENPNDLLSGREEDGLMGRDHVQEDVMPSEPERAQDHVQEEVMPSVVSEPSKPEPKLESNDLTGSAHVNVIPSVVSEPEQALNDPIDVTEDVMPTVVSEPQPSKPESESNDEMGSAHVQEDVISFVPSETSDSEQKPNDLTSQTEKDALMGRVHVQEDVMPSVPSGGTSESKPNDVLSETGEDGLVGLDHVQKDTISSETPEPNDPKPREDGPTARVIVQEDVISSSVESETSEKKLESNDPETREDGPQAQGQVQEDVISSKQEPKPTVDGVLPNDSLKHVQLRANCQPKSPLGPVSGKITQNREEASSREVSPKSDKVGSEKQLEKSNIKIGDIDTTAPFESVKAAVSMFAGIVDWKAHKIRIAERRKYVQQELRKAHYEMPLFKKKAEAAEEEKRQVLKELDDTKRLIEELKLNLERTQTEERQAKQDAELAKLRVEEMEQGISDDSSVAAKAQLEVAQARNQAAIAELKRVKNELENLQKDYDLLLMERDIAIKNAEEAVSNSREIEKTVEGLTIKLITTKEALESAHAAHLEAEEHRIGVAMARDQDASNWEKELQQAQEELEKVNRQIISTEELKSKLDTASALLQDLKLELAAYMGEEKESNESQKINNSTHKDIQSAVDLAKMNLEQVKKEIEKATEGINHLKLKATSLNSELEKEKATLVAIRRTEGMASVTVASLEAELKTMTSELDLVRKKEKEAREKMAELPKQLQKAAEEADRAKSLARAAREELQKAKEAADQAKAGENRMTTRLNATQKEIEAARASERLALGAISALHESESARSNKNELEYGVTLSLEEYYELSRKVQEAEDQANLRVTEAISQIDVAKESETKALAKLGQINTDLVSRKEELSIAMQKAQKAKEGKLVVEQELRTWRADHEQKRKARDDGCQRGVVQGSNTKGTTDMQPPSHSAHNHKPDTKPETNNNGTGSSRETKPRKKKRRSFFPRFFMFFSRKKHSNKST